MVDREEANGKQNGHRHGGEEEKQSNGREIYAVTANAANGGEITTVNGEYP